MTLAKRQPGDLLNQVIQGDARMVLRTLPDQLAGVCVTSPPYWSLRDYGIQGQLGLEATPEEYVDQLVQVFREVKRVLKPGRTLWLVLGDTYYSGAGACRSPGGKKGPEHPRGLPPNRRPGTAGLKPKDLVGIPWRVALALQADGWWLRSCVIWHKVNAMPSGVKDRPACRYEFVFMLSNAGAYKFNLDAIRQAHAPSTVKRVSHRRERDQSPLHLRSDALQPHRLPGPEGIVLNSSGKNPGDVWSIAHAKSRSEHHATFPTELAERAIKAGSDEGDLVLDPFCGTGTALDAAERFGRKWLGIDLRPRVGAAEELQPSHLA